MTFAEKGSKKLSLWIKDFLSREYEVLIHRSDE